MNRDKTVEFFLECEAKRAEVLAAALAEGKPEREAASIAHEAAKAHWNDWANGLLVERKAREADGRWAAEKDVFGNLEAKNEETRAWMQKALADFSRCLFLVRGVEGTLVRGVEGTKEAAGETKEDENAGLPVKSIQLEGNGTNFSGFVFPGYASFNGAQFTGGDASFDGAQFTGGGAWFDGATFKRLASFRGQTFTNDIFFNGATFEPEGRADFGLATFERVAQFNGAKFLGEADFNAVWGKRTFSMSGAEFDAMPDFIQAHFDEAPRLDNVQVRARWYGQGSAWTWPWRIAKGAWRRLNGGHAEDSELRDMPARWRALKRLAIQGHDTDRELEFHARELRSRRFVGEQRQRFGGDWPLPLAFWRLDAWAGVLRFWFGVLYGLFSNYGRSLFWPFFYAGVAAIAAAAFYLSQTEVMQRQLALQNLSYFDATVKTARYALADKVHCYPPPSESWRNHWPYWRKGEQIDPTASRVDGLTPKFQGQTNARAEAWHLAFRNASIVLDTSSEAAHRTFGCLYGVELYGGSNPLAVVPRAVSTVSAAQKVFSALMIFLFGLALRNMLKMK
jgi:uncharacterized protein YjbI with pentapeptide repeats